MRECPDYPCVCNDFLHCALLSLLARLLLWEVIDQQIPPCLSLYHVYFSFVSFLPVWLPELRSLRRGACTNFGNGGSRLRFSAGDSRLAPRGDRVKEFNVRVHMEQFQYLTR